MGKHAAPRRRRVSLGTPLVGGLAVAATGAVVAGGVVLTGGGGEALAAADSIGQVSLSAADTTSTPVERTESLSRSRDRREATDATKVASLAAAAQSQVKAVTEKVDAADSDPKTIASSLLADYGWDRSQFDCLDKLWMKESGWRVNADNPSSSAYGIPQALPGSKMASAGPNWQTNPVTQIKWGLGYIQGRYGSPCGAWGYSQSHGWY